ncbi:MAG TPA: DoxX family protein [Acidimicrobiia bacterium]|nr:DoxX family protein [Acidimicrobiia bacterium]
MSAFGDVAKLSGRVVLGGYMIAHGAQKAFGMLGGKGPERAGEDFERRGLSPGREMAMLAAGVEMAGGAGTALGIAHPIPELAIATNMAVAAASDRRKGPLAAQGGYELALTDAAFATLLAFVGPGHLRLGRHASRRMTVLAIVAGAWLATTFVSMMERRAQGGIPNMPTPDERADVPSVGDDVAAPVPATP